MRTLNLGILAHVDAGKTSLTERLLYNAGAITAIGSVDEGSTQTDSLALERARGITIKAAVASFPVGRTTVNLIDTPGHPDFIAEVERALSVLDGAVLVVSAVEGVQPQTRILMRALRRLGLPALIFVNKIDRGGAEPQRVLRDIAAKLTPAVVPMGTVHGAGTRDAGFRRYGAGDAEFAAALADLLADHDDRFLAAYLADEAAASYPRLRAGLAGQTRAGRVHPVFFGHHRRGHRGVGRGPDPAAARRGRRRCWPGVRPGVQGRARPGRGEDRLGPDVLRHGVGPEPGALRPAWPGPVRPGQGDRGRNGRPGGAEHAGRRGDRGPDRPALGPGRDPDR